LADYDADDCVKMADGQVRAAYALRDDLLAVLFPHGDGLPSELLQTRVKLKLLALVDGIERQLLPSAAGKQQSWEPLARSGLLREGALVHFALARIAEQHVLRNMQASGISPLAQLPAELGRHDNKQLSVMARKLLQAEQADSDEQLFLRLPGELLHTLCWRVVAALQESETADLVEKAKALLAAHDPDNDPASVARKLVFFLGTDYRAELADPRRAGLHLFIASICQKSGVDSDLLYRLFAESSVQPLLLLLKAQAVAVDALPAILSVLRRSDDMEISPLLADVYASLDPIDARVAIACWVAEGRSE
jgi:hypothetical protein